MAKYVLKGATPSLIPGFYADPNIVEFDGIFYLYLTSDGFDDWSATNFKVFSSTNLIDWQDHGVIFSLTSDTVWAEKYAWAPTVTRKNGIYYFYFSAQDCIGVAVSDSPVGKFIDLGRPLITEGEFSGRAIDPSIFIDDDETQYLLWGNGVAHIAPLQPDMTSFKASSVIDLNLPNFREAPWMHKRGGTYYLSWSENDTRDEDYRVTYAIGNNVSGPWKYQGEIISKKPDRGILGTGHHSILRIPGTDDWVLAYHRFAIPNGNGFHREVVLEKLHHTPQGYLYPVIPSEYKIRIDENGALIPA